MATFPICCKTSYKEQNLPIQSVIRQNNQRFMHDCVNMMRTSSNPSHICRACHFSHTASDIFTRPNRREGIAPRCLIHGRGSVHTTMTEMTPQRRVCGPESNIRFIQSYYPKKDKLATIWYSAEPRTNEEQLRSLDSYFGKLRDNGKPSSFDSSNKLMQLHQRDGQSRLKNGLQSLDAYLGKLNNGANQESLAPSTYIEQYNEDNQAQKPLSISKDTERGYYGKQFMNLDIRRRKGEHGLRSSNSSRQPDETSSLYLIGILASIDIAVFLFEIASPIRNSELDLFSVPLLYGAKINHLIVVGEWWRLVTPMFLHSGIFHVALTCWALISFGPQVCRGYGSFTFFLIYILGGISGNLTSYLHTPEPTVGGTGPVFAIIGAWLAYQIQNRDVFASDASETMFWKALIVTAIGFILSNFGPIDDWTHFGAAFTGMAYGFFTSPTLQLDDASSATGQEEGIKLVRRYGDSCKSLIVFIIFILILSSFLFFMEPPLWSSS